MNLEPIYYNNREIVLSFSCTYISWTIYERWIQEEVICGQHGEFNVMYLDFSRIFLVDGWYKYQFQFHIHM